MILSILTSTWYEVVDTQILGWWMCYRELRHPQKKLWLLHQSIKSLNAPICSSIQLIEEYYAILLPKTSGMQTNIKLASHQTTHSTRARRVQ
jgi:hypothetical protein